MDLPDQYYGFGEARYPIPAPVLPCITRVGLYKFLRACEEYRAHAMRARYFMENMMRLESWRDDEDGDDDDCQCDDDDDDLADFDPTAIGRPGSCCEQGQRHPELDLQGRGGVHRPVQDRSLDGECIADARSREKSEEEFDIRELDAWWDPLWHTRPVPLPPWATPQPKARTSPSPAALDVEVMVGSGPSAESSSARPSSESDSSPPWTEQSLGDPVRQNLWEHYYLEMGDSPEGDVQVFEPDKLREDESLGVDHALCLLDKTQTALHENVSDAADQATPALKRRRC
jgi:hypothetical protein